MEIEVDDVGELSVGAHVQRRGEAPERHLAQDLSVGGAVLQKVPVGSAVSEGYVEELAVGRQVDSVRTVELDRQETGLELALHARSGGPETNERDRVRRLGDDPDQIVQLGIGGRSRAHEAREQQNRAHG